MHWYCRRWAALTVSCGALVLGVACSGETLPYAGGLMVAVQTDLAAPKDVAAVGLYITSDGKPIFGDTRNVAPNGEVKFPATIAVLADAARPRAVVKIRAVAFKPNGDVRVLRDVITTIPKGRTGLLRTPLLWINEGSGSGNRNQLLQSASIRPRDATSDGFSRLTSACPDEQTFIDGECADARVDGDALPTYTDAAVFGGGDATGKGGRCYDVATCFAGAAPVALDAATCIGTVPGGSLDDPNLTLAIALPSSADAGECLPNGTCLVPLDRGSGWKVGAAGAELPRALCGRIAEGKATGIVASRACPAKDTTTPSCGPASSVSPTTPTGGEGGVDGGPVGDQDFETPLVSKRSEPLLSAIAVDDQNIFLARAAPSLPAGIVRVKKSDITTQTQPEDFAILFSYPNGIEARSSLVLDPGTTAQHVVVLGETDGLKLCTPTSNNDCVSVPIQAPPRGLASGLQEAYVYGDSGGTLGLYAIPFAAPIPQLRASPPNPFVMTLTLSKDTLYFGTDDAAVYRCTLPCANPGDVTQFRAPPAKPALLTALVASDKVPNKIFVMQVPTSPDVSAGGVFALDTAGGPEVQLATGEDLEAEGASPEPPSALAVDSRYVYWGGGFNDPRDNVRKRGLVRRNHQTLAPAQPFLEATQGTEPVSMVAVDGAHVFWTFYRAGNSLLFAKKASAF